MPRTSLRLLVLAASCVCLAASAACGSDDGVAPGSPGPSTVTDGGGVTPGTDAGVVTNEAGPTDAQADGPEPPYTGPRTQSIAASDSGACAITEGGVLRCWGRGSAEPQTIKPGTTFAKVTLGEADGGSTCAIETNGALWCWTRGAPTPVEVVGGPWSEVAIGEDQWCAIATTGIAYCWGTNTYGQLGVGDNAPRTAPASVGSDTDWQRITAGENATCAIKANGKLFCWGRAGSGGNQLQSTTPVAVEPAQDFKDVWLYGLNRVGVSADGAMRYGNGETFAVSNTTAVWKKARLGGSSSNIHRCALDETGSVFCLGANSRGQLGDGTQVFTSLPVRVGAEGDWLDIATGTSFSCGISKDGAARCWGAATNGQLGRGGVVGTGRTSPTQVGSATDWIALSANQTRTCGTRGDGSIYCWGQAISLGLSNVDQQVPTSVATGGFTSVELGLYQQCSRKDDGTFACWGSNGYGECGIGSITPTPLLTPTTVGLSVKSYSPAHTHTCATDQADHVFCWGNHLYNQLGFTAAAPVPSPTQVGSETWSKVVSTYSNNCAIRTDGALYCFGFSFTDFERIGNDVEWTALATTPNDNIYWGIRAGVPYTWSGNGGSKVPGAIPGATGTWTAIAANFSHLCGVRADGTLVCSGTNAFGELGDGTTTSRATPVQVGTSTDWKAVAIGYTHSCAIKTNGTLWCWGATSAGQIGDGTAWSTVPVTVLL